MSRILISNDGECILIRQGTTVIVLDPKQAESVAATLVAEYETMENRNAVKEFDRECRSFHAVHVPPRNTSRTIGADGNDEARRRPLTDSERDRIRQRIREAGLDGVDCVEG